MKNLKHFTILEKDNIESPMVGTITKISDDAIGRTDLKEILTELIKDHFDTNVFNYNAEIPDLFCGSPSETISITIDDNVYDIDIIETWLK